MHESQNFFGPNALARAISKILFILGSYNFLAYLECVRSYAWSKGHSDPDLSSVGSNTIFIQIYMDTPPGGLGV